MLLLDSIFLAISLTHFNVDLLNGQRAVLLTYLSGPLGLTNTGLGVVATAYTVTSALVQPVFGHISDRIGARWVVGGGLFWMMVFFSLAVTIPGRVALAFLVLASLGSGAFHPAGTMQATYLGRSRFAGRETTSTSYFFLLGQLGLFLGPLVGGFILAARGPAGLLILAALAIPVGVNAIFQLRSTTPQPVDNPAPKMTKSNVLEHGVWLLLGLALMAAFRSWTQQNMTTFVPKYLSDLGQSPDVYGSLAAVFMAGTAIGTVTGGMLADRFGKRRVATTTLLLASVPLGLVPMIGWLPWLYVVIPLAGMLSGASHSIIIVSAQHIIPGGRGLASGLILGFMFSSGALGTLLSGYLADLWGITFVFRLSAVLVMAAAGLALVLREN